MEVFLGVAAGYVLGLVSAYGCWRLVSRAYRHPEEAILFGVAPPAEEPEPAQHRHRFPPGPSSEDGTVRVFTCACGARKFEPVPGTPVAPQGICSALGTVLE